MRFRNRHDAGRRLAKLLSSYIRKPAIVYALPRGGVPLGVEIALAHQLPLDLAIARKIGHPSQPEYAVCAVTEDGEPVCDPQERLHLDPGWLAQRIAEQRAEAARRRQLYSGGYPRHLATGKCAILVDDGLATGLSMEAAIREIRADRPARLIVAAAVAPRSAVEHFRTLCDEVVVVELPEHYQGSVGTYYEDFSQLSDEQVLQELARVQAPRPQLHSEA